MADDFKGTVMWKKEIYNSKPDSIIKLEKFPEYFYLSFDFSGDIRAVRLSYSDVYSLIRNLNNYITEIERLEGMANRNLRQ